MASKTAKENLKKEEEKKTAAFDLLSNMVACYKGKNNQFFESDIRMFMKRATDIVEGK